MKIGIDIDDTVSKTNERLIEEAVKYDSEVLRGRGFKNPDAYSFMEMFYWSVVDVDNFLKKFRKSNAFYELEPKEYAAQVITKLYEAGNEIYFITRRQNTFKVKSMTKKWMKKNGFKYNKIFFHIREKGKFAEDLGIDLFIDNDEKNVYEALEYNIDSLLMATRYNENVTDLKRVNDWKEIYKYIKEK
jgi:5'(3')-deoxyribonucleotidase